MALHCAASRGHTECIQTLVSITILLLLLLLLCFLLQVMLCGAEVNALDVNGCSPIFYSVALGYVDATRSCQSINMEYSINLLNSIFRMLISLGASTNIKDRKGRTAGTRSVLKKLQTTLFSSLLAFGFIFPVYLRF